MIKIELSGKTMLVINEGKVTAPSKRLTKIFNYMERDLPRYGAREAWDGDLYIAEELVKELGGTIVHCDPMPPSPEGITL